MSAAAPIITDRSEFVDASIALRKGHVLIRVYDRPGGCLLDGCPVTTITQRGWTFADKACRSWRRRPWTQRLVLRVTGREAMLVCRESDEHPVRSTVRSGHEASARRRWLFMECRRLSRRPP